jgi:hypothetical protein
MNGHSTHPLQESLHAVAPDESGARPDYRRGSRRQGSPESDASSRKVSRGSGKFTQGSRQKPLTLWGGPLCPVTARDRRRSSGSVSRQSRASQEPAFVLGARCNSSRPHGRGRDQDPRVVDERWRANGSRRVLWGRGRWQRPTGGGSGRARGEGRRDVGPALDQAKPRVPKRVGPAQGLEQRRVDLTRAVCSDGRPLAKTLDSVHVTANTPGTRCSAKHTHYRAADRLGPVMSLAGREEPARGRTERRED